MTAGPRGLVAAGLLALVAISAAACQPGAQVTLVDDRQRNVSEFAIAR